jgi:hypothetical protein
MDDVKKFLIGGVITLVLGGTAYTFTQEDVINNFAEDTGVSQEQAKEYVNNIKESDIVPYQELGAGLVSDGRLTVDTAEEIDCVNYEYDWETTLLSCDDGKSQLRQSGEDDIALGNSYIKLDSDTTTVSDIQETISLIDKVNANYDLPILQALMTSSDIDEIKKTNSYNKSLLKSALEGEK